MTLQDIITQKPYLAWYVKDPGHLSEGSVLEHVLNYGNWDDVQKYIQIKGLKETAKIFMSGTNHTRSNYLPEIQSYFQKYFQKHAF